MLPMSNARGAARAVGLLRGCCPCYCACTRTGCGCRFTAAFRMRHCLRFLWAPTSHAATTTTATPLPIGRLLLLIARHRPLAGTTLAWRPSSSSSRSVAAWRSIQSTSRPSSSAVRLRACLSALHASAAAAPAAVPAPSSALASRLTHHLPLCAHPPSATRRCGRARRDQRVSSALPGRDVPQPQQHRQSQAGGPLALLARAPQGGPRRVRGGAAHQLR